MNKFKYILVSLTLISLFQYCSDDTTGSTSATNGALTVTGPTSISNNLSTTGSATVVIAAGAFTGDVTLAIDRTEIDNDFSAGSDIAFALSDSTLTLAANETKNVTLTYTVKASAPSFKSTKNGGSGQVVINATIASTNQVLKATIPFEVDPIYEVRVSALSTIGGMEPTPPNNGKGQHTWTTGLGAIPTNTTFRHHDGLKIRFINTDINYHVIHANNAINHEPDPGMAPSTSIGQDGGVYEVNPDQSAGNPTIWYCHKHSSEGTIIDPHYNFNFTP